MTTQQNSSPSTTQMNTTVLSDIALPHQKSTTGVSPTSRREPKKDIIAEMDFTTTSADVTRVKIHDLTDLPNEMIDIIASFLHPEDVVCCSLVSRKWLLTFTQPDLAKHVLKANFPRAREVRVANDTSNWAALLTAVTGRYHFLQKGAPYYSEKLPLQQAFVEPGWARHYPVGSWRRNLHFEGRVANFHHPDTLWAYDDGLLVLPSAKTQKYQVYDIAAGSYSDVNFEVENRRFIRRMRLCEKVLAVEWAEAESMERFDGLRWDPNHSHFITVYDIIPGNGKAGETDGPLKRRPLESNSNNDSNCGWITQFRCEWRIGGVPLDSIHRFYSTHNSSHYALYCWEPNNSLERMGAPSESLSIWDISTPHPYRPSLDPTSRKRPLIPSSGARLIKHLSYRDLRFYNLLQGTQPRFRELVIDAGHVYVIEEDHRWLVGNETGALPRLHRLKSTGIPFGDGPVWVDECGADGDVHLSFCQRTTEQGGVGAPPCWRHEEFPYLTVSEVFDEEAGVRFSARQCFMLESISLNMQPHIRVSSTNILSSQIALPDNYWKELMQKGKICGDERWIVGENENKEVVILYFDWLVGRKKKSEKVIEQEEEKGNGKRKAKDMENEIVLPATFANSGLTG